MLTAQRMRERALPAEFQSFLLTTPSSAVLRPLLYKAASHGFTTISGLSSAISDGSIFSAPGTSATSRPTNVAELSWHDADILAAALDIRDPLYGTTLTQELIEIRMPAAVSLRFLPISKVNRIYLGGLKTYAALQAASDATFEGFGLQRYEIDRLRAEILLKED